MIKRKKYLKTKDKKQQKKKYFFLIYSFTQVNTILFFIS